MLPNPDFVFPLPSPQSSTSPGFETPSYTRRRPQSLQTPAATHRTSADGARKSVNALPEFSFNPSSETTNTNPTTPPISPLPTSPLTPRHTGHRRGGSEFIGGDGRTGGIGLMSSSPTKPDNILPSPSSTLKPGPPPGRRGHAHRRSGAISCHDLNSILQPKDPNASGRSGGSAPSTPMENEMSNWPRHSANKSISNPSLRTFAQEENDHSGDEATSRRPPSRARVGFSDTVEYIRPLSTISSETESSISTIRGHSVSNSLSSVISAGAPSPPSSRMSRQNTFEQLNGPIRPKTAGAVLDKAAKKQDPMGIDLFKRQRSTPGIYPASPSSPGPLSPGARQAAKKKGFFGLKERRSSPSADLLTSASEPSLLTPSSDSPPESPFNESNLDSSNEALDIPRVKDKTKRARKVKSWTNPFGSKKPKSPNTKPVDLNPEAPISPSSSTTIDEMSLDDLTPDFDVDNTITIVTPTTDVMPRPQLQTDFASWKPKHISPSDSESRSPIIDLDLAMGPFESDKRPRVGATGRNFASARKTMHSSGFATGLFPPQNHRRTESAPALVPFELRKASSTSAMADVFEEEEEDEVTSEVSRPSQIAQKAVSLQSPKTETTPIKPPALEEEPNVGIQMVDSDFPAGSPITWNFNESSLRSRERKQRATIEDMPHSPYSVPASVPEDSSPVEVVEDYEEPRTSSLTRSSDSTITPTNEEGPKELSPPMSLPVPLPQQTVMTPETINTSSFPSPDFRFRQTSFDTPRLGTASSVADNRTLNSFLGEPGPEVRMSVDDVPSLTSSRSTMTSGLHHGNLPMLSPRNPGDRASSVSSDPSVMSERRRKRSSIASLSRLMTGSFTERSKLHIEQRPQSEHMDLNTAKKSKDKRTKRLSKLMSFWRSSSYSK